MAVLTRSINDSGTPDAQDGNEDLGNSLWVAQDNPYPNGHWFSVKDKSAAKERNGGLRFENITVSGSDTVSLVELTVYIRTLAPAQTFDIDVSIDDVDNAVAWSNSSRPSSGFTASVNSPVTFATGTTSNVSKTIDVTSLFTDVQGRGGWASGNAVRFALFNPSTLSYRGADFADYESDDSANSAVLEITYTTAGGNTITANVTESGDVAVASLASPRNVIVSVTEGGDTVAASLATVTTSAITASVTEEGDTVAAILNNVVQITANITEDGDTSTASLTSPRNVAASQSEGGDGTTASIVGVVTSLVTSNQAEGGDSQVVSITSLRNVAANQAEDGDTNTAVIVSGFINVTANQAEDGDVQVASILISGPPNNIALIRNTKDFSLIRNTKDFNLLKVG